MMDERLITLETKVAYQEDLIQELRDALDEHWQLIDRLSREVKALETKLAAITPSQVKDAKDESPPPHY